jgi:hypothetical protein
MQTLAPPPAKPSSHAFSRVDEGDWNRGSGRLRGRHPPEAPVTRAVWPLRVLDLGTGLVKVSIVSVSDVGGEAGRPRATPHFKAADRPPRG